MKSQWTHFKNVGRKPETITNLVVLILLICSSSFKPLYESRGYTHTDTLFVDGEIWIRDYYGKRFVTYELDIPKFQD